MDPYFEIYIPRLTQTLKASQLRARRRLPTQKGGGMTERLLRQADIAACWDHPAGRFKF